VLGGIPLDMIQKWINEWYSSSLDLFGGEDSSNASTFFASGLKGRHHEQRDPVIKDHVALEGIYILPTVGDSGRLSDSEIPLRRAMNQVLRDSYANDCQRAVDIWNKTLHKNGISNFEFRLPSQRFNRKVGVYSGLPFSTTGELIDNDDAYQAHHASAYPSAADRNYVQSLMVACYEPGQFANWISPPTKGINRQAMDFKYRIGVDDPDYAELEQRAGRIVEDTRPS